MSVWARSDVCYVGISRDHGGCGEGHSRPVVQGAPVQVWQLTCGGGCEDYLRGDPLWSATPTGIPETVDEKATREDVEKRGALEQAQATADALSQLAKLGDLPAVLGRFMEFMASGGQLPAAPRADVVATREGAAPALPPVAAEPGSAGGGLPEDLESMSLPELKALAETRGVKTTRSKADQIAALREAADGA